MSKQIQIKSFDIDGVYVKTITDATFDTITKVINGGIGNLSLKLARKFDAYNPNGDVTLGNRIEIWVYDEDSGNDGVILYKGWVEQQNPFIDGGEEYVEILCTSLIARMRNDVLKDTAQTTLFTIATLGLTTTVGSIAAAEIADVVKAIVDKFSENNPSVDINYNPAGTDLIIDTEKEMQYTFEAMTYIDAIEKCRQVAPQNTYWRIESDGNIYFNAPSNSADHIFTIGKDIKKIEASNSLDSVKNIVLIWDGQATTGLYTEYKDDTSIASYGRRVNQLVDSNIADQATMDNIGNSYIQENKDPKVRITLEIIDNNENDKGYNIESIDPGDTCRIVGINEADSIFGDNMIIKQVIWESDKATLIIETERDFDLNRYILNIEKDLNQDQKYQIPVAYS